MKKPTELCDLCGHGQTIQKLEGKIQKLKNERDKWKHWWNEEAVKIEMAQQTLNEFREEDLKTLLDEIERGCYKTQTEVLNEVIRLFDDKHLCKILSEGGTEAQVETAKET